MLALVAAEALELARPVRRHGRADLLRRGRGGGQGESGMRWRLGTTRSGGEGERAREPEEDGPRPPHGLAPDPSTESLASGPSAAWAAGMPIGGGSLCWISVWQRAHSMLWPATWKSWMKGVSA